MRRALVLGGLMLAAAACRSPRPTQQVPQPPVEEVWEPPPAREAALYSAQEALRDVLSGELEYVGTGHWPGVERSRACAFRNQRVLIVNAYCTLDDVQAFRMEVYSPERGRVRIYAETKGAVSTRQHSDYFTFTVEGGLPPAAASQLPPLSLSMSYEQLRRYEQQRYDAYLPGCFGGKQNERPIAGCLGALAPRQGEWAELNRAFLDRANDDWYQVVRKLRALATQYGVRPED